MIQNQWDSGPLSDLIVTKPVIQENQWELKELLTKSRVGKVNGNSTEQQLIGSDIAFQ